MSHGIFFSYRRDDRSGFAGRLFDRLAESFPREQVFIDVEGIEPGANFADVLSEQVGDCDVLLALIGPRWLTAAAADGRGRLSDPKDFVRIEIDAALTRDVRVIPLLIDGTPMPTAGELPEPVRALALRQAVSARLLGDRAYALIDTETGKVVSAKSVKLFPDLLDCRAAFVEAPRPGGGGDRVTLV